MATQGNTRLMSYGIQNERSDLRAHVCIIANRIYVYPTACGIQAIDRGIYPERPVYTGAIQTASGYAVPWNDIPKCVAVRIPEWLLTEINLQDKDTTSEKGRKAVAICTRMIAIGAFPLPAAPDEAPQGSRIQIEGTDIIVTINARIQIKCDYRGGSREHGGTGNLYLQIAECNPHRAY